MWKPEYAEARRARYAADPAERERRKQQGRDPERNAEYMRAYYLAHPERFKRTPEQQAKVNAARRERYANDAEYRERCKAEARGRDKEAIRDGRLRSQFGISAAEYDAMLDAQGGGCAICGNTASGDGRGHRLHVDHCHESGQVRGILCAACNLGLGKFADDSERLRAAVAYLARAVDCVVPDKR